MNKKKYYFFNFKLLFKLTKNYKNKMDNLDAINIYNTIWKDFFDIESKKYIIIENLFILLIDLNNKLNIN